ncbi:hypothetical protein E1176_15935 [Fulvivirga sp. RKSG066]|uniref:SRPBCC family protein n=1 Tax=Fulvivirga aurantia TaxID=2529383 RepID=UPI0012BC2986|nr:SRPBCC family protein [Fulvivirga aurantia]MTI22522.1 hypothetical protein [Fulvivirga aurantia]
MKVYRITRKQTLPLSIDEAWEFFSSPYNLKKITPPSMGFNITHISGGERMYEGQIITYRLNPVPGIPVNWTTEITHVKRPSFFVDQQLTGPYALWHHQHHFKETDQGVEMIDEVNYAIPLGIIGRFANWLFVGKRVSAIFDYRYNTLKKLFNK